MVTFDGKILSQKDNNGNTLRRKTMPSNIVNAQSDGDGCIVQCDNGIAYVLDRNLNQVRTIRR